MDLKMTRIEYARLHNEEWILMQTHYTNEVLDYGPVRLKIDRLFTKHQEFYMLSDELTEKIKKSFFTKVSSAEDERRGLIFRGLRDNVKAFINFPDPLKQKAAEELFAVIENYAKSIINGNSASETAAIDNLNQDLTGAKGGTDMSAQVAQLGIENWVDALKESNEAYKDAMTQRNEEAKNKPEAGSLARLRTETDHICTLMLNVIDAQLAVVDDSYDEPSEGGGGTPEGRTLTDDENLVEFAKSLNRRLAYFKTLLEQRKTRKANANANGNTEVGDEE